MADKEVRDGSGLALYQKQKRRRKGKRGTGQNRKVKGNKGEDKTCEEWKT